MKCGCSECGSGHSHYGHEHKKKECMDVGSEMGNDMVAIAIDNCIG